MKSEKPEVSRKHLATAFFKGDKQIPLRDNILVNLSYCNALMGKKGGEKRGKKKKKWQKYGCGIWKASVGTRAGEDTWGREWAYIWAQKWGGNGKSKLYKGVSSHAHPSMGTVTPSKSHSHRNLRSEWSWEHQNWIYFFFSPSEQEKSVNQMLQVLQAWEAIPLPSRIFSVLCGTWWDSLSAAFPLRGPPCTH